MLNQCRLLSRLSILGVKIVNRWIIESSSVSSDGLLNHRMKKKKQLDFLFKVFYYIAKWAHREKWGRSDKRKVWNFHMELLNFFFRRNFHAYDSQWMHLIFIIKHPLSLLLVAHSTLSRQALWGGRLLCGRPTFASIRRGDSCFVTILNSLWNLTRCACRWARILCPSWPESSREDVWSLEQLSN